MCYSTVEAVLLFLSSARGYLKVWSAILSTEDLELEMEMLFWRTLGPTSSLETWGSFLTMSSCIFDASNMKTRSDLHLWGKEEFCFIEMITVILPLMSGADIQNICYESSNMDYWPKMTSILQKNFYLTSFPNGGRGRNKCGDKRSFESSSIQFCKLFHTTINGGA